MSLAYIICTPIRNWLVYQQSETNDETFSIMQGMNTYNMNHVRVRIFQIQIIRHANLYTHNAEDL